MLVSLQFGAALSRSSLISSVLLEDKALTKIEEHRIYGRHFEKMTSSSRSAYAHLDESGKQRLERQPYDAKATSTYKIPSLALLLYIQRIQVAYKVLICLFLLLIVNIFSL